MRPLTIFSLEVEIYRRHSQQTTRHSVSCLVSTYISYIILLIFKNQNNYFLFSVGRYLISLNRAAAVASAFRIQLTPQRPRATRIIYLDNFNDFTYNCRFKMSSFFMPRMFLAVRRQSTFYQSKGSSRQCWIYRYFQ